MVTGLLLVLEVGSSLPPSLPRPQLRRFRRQIGALCGLCILPLMTGSGGFTILRGALNQKTIYGLTIWNGFVPSQVSPRSCQCSTSRTGHGKKSLKLELGVFFPYFLTCYAGVLVSNASDTPSLVVKQVITPPQ